MFSPGVVAKLRAAVVVAQRGVGEGGEAVSQRQRAGNALQWRNVRAERVEDGLVEQFFARQCAFLRRQGLVLEGLQLGRDEALGVLQRLAAAVVVRHLVGIGTADFDIETMDTVELNLEAGNAAALALARLKCKQELAAIGLDVAQLVQLAVVAGGNDATVAHHGGGLGGDGTLQQFERIGRNGECGADFAQQRGAAAAQCLLQRGQAGEGVAQGGQVARARTAQRNAGGDPVHVGHSAQGAAHGGGAAAGAGLQALDGKLVATLGHLLTHQLSNRRMARSGHCPLAQGVVQGVTQPARAHAGHAGVEQREQGGRGFAAQGFGEFEVAPGGGVQAQVLGFALDDEAGDVGEGLALSGLGIVVERRRGTEGHRQVFDAETDQIAGAEVVCQQPSAGLGVELPVREAAQGRRQRLDQGQRQPVGNQHFGRAQTLELRLQGFGRALHQAQVAVGKVEPGQAEHATMQVGREQQGVATVIEQRGVRQRAGGDDAADGALHRPLGRTRLADLLGDDHGFAELHQARQVLFDGVEGHARHLDRLAAGLAAGGQRDVEQARGFFGVVEEELVEIAHAIEQQGVRVLQLDAQILLHHRRVLRDFGFAQFAGLGLRRQCNLWIGTVRGRRVTHTGPVMIEKQPRPAGERLLSAPHQACRADGR